MSSLGAFPRGIRRDLGTHTMPSALSLLLLAWTPHVPHHPAAPHTLVPQRPVAPPQKRARPPCAGVTGLTGWIGRTFPSTASKVPERFEADVVAIDLNAERIWERLVTKVRVSKYVSK